MASLSDQSIAASEPQITLLFQNASRQVLKLNDFIEETSPVKLQVKSLHDISIDSVISFIFKSWDSTQRGDLKPEVEQQIRLIHLGHPLEGKNLSVGDLKLDISDIVHVIVRPLEGLKELKKQSSRKAINNSLSRHRTPTSNRQISDTTDGETNDSKSGCCIIA